MKIKFSHRYPKLYGQLSGTLLHIIVKDRSELSDKFVEYDTRYTVSDAIGVCSEEIFGHFPLPKNKYMVLVFIGNDLIPFTTVRRYTEEKFRYYKSGIGSVLNIEYASTV